MTIVRMLNGGTSSNPARVLRVLSASVQDEWSAEVRCVYEWLSGWEERTVWVVAQEKSGEGEGREQ